MVKFRLPESLSLASAIICYRCSNHIVAGEQGEVLATNSDVMRGLDPRIHDEEQRVKTLNT